MINIRLKLNMKELGLKGLLKLKKKRRVTFQLPQSHHKYHKKGNTKKNTFNDIKRSKNRQFLIILW